MHSGAAHFDLPPRRAPHRDPDAPLLERVRSGDRKALQALFERHGTALVNFAYRFLGSRDRAEEIAQTAFLQLFHARKRYATEAPCTTLIYRIAAHLCLEGSDRRTDEEPPPAEERDAAAEVRRLVAGLPPNQRMALLLSRVDGFTHRDVADCLGISDDAAKSLIFRATTTLRRGLGSEPAVVDPVTRPLPADRTPPFFDRVVSGISSPESGHSS